MRGYAKRFGAASLKGGRPRQEDRFGRMDIGEFELFAIADGFSKEPDGSDKTGARVSGMVMSSVLELAPARIDRADIPSSTLGLYSEIDSRTQDELSGSTLALALIDKEDMTAHVAALGDTMAVFSPPAGEPSYVPFAHRIGLGSCLWGCFGDRENRRWHSQTPEMTSFPYVPGAVILIGCDGLFASNEFDVIAARSAELVALIRGGASAEDLAMHSLSEYGSTDNVTALFMEFE